MNLLRMLVLGGPLLAACSSSATPDVPDAREVATDATDAGDIADTQTDSVDIVQDVMACPPFPGRLTAQPSGDAGSLPSGWYEAAVACAMAGICYGVDQRGCVEAYLEARAGSVSLLHEAHLGTLAGTWSGNPELGAILLASARGCVLTATSCDALATCLGATGSPGIFMPGDQSACSGSRMLMRTTASCGPERAVAIDCATYGLNCVTSDVGQAICADQTCPSAGATPTCDLGPTFQQCDGQARVSGNCADMPWLETPTCWRDLDDNDVQCASGNACDHEFQMCTATGFQACVFRADATPNYVLDSENCSLRAPGLHCDMVPGSMGQVGCLAGTDCAPQALSCVGSVAQICAFGVQVNVDCSAAGGSCGATGCVGG